ncbi:hypothetical protein HOE37_06690 [Candidatus Woesearchaeota archaeon]|jgi:hypothetical protein|nr:hypothetical protein [Candidatus Woesearchaeota archaeon]
MLGLKEKVKKGIVSKKEAFQIVHKWKKEGKLHSTTLIPWLKNYYKDKK